MCGIVGYVGKGSCRSFVLEGLVRLEYRGYDSAGFVCLDAKTGRMCSVKAAGSLDALKNKLADSAADGSVGMGHTRWATHGTSTEENAHPHFNGARTISVVHNGIIENYQAIKRQLEAKGHSFYSKTDTEVIAHLFDDALAADGFIKRDIKSAVEHVVKQLEGAFSCAVVLEQFPGLIIAIRKRSPLCIGFGQEQMFVASDVAAFSQHTRRVLYLPDESFALVEALSVALYDFLGEERAYSLVEVDELWLHSTKEDFEHYMLKEIYEQKRVIHDTVAFCRNMSSSVWAQTGLSGQRGVDLKEIDFIACGTSAHAAQIAAFFFEEICRVESSVQLASEFRHRPMFLDKNKICCLLSQSGETADTIEGLRLARNAGVQTLSLVNVPQSTMVRESDGFILTQAKREVAVASTKSFTSQVALLYWMAHRLAVEKGILPYENLESVEQDLLMLAEIFEEVMDRYGADIIHRHAPRYAHFEKFIFLGRQISYPFAREAALKLKEIAYRFVDCYPAGELKHGSIALVEPSIPVFIFSALDEGVYRKILSGAQEVKARDGHLVAFAFEGQDELIELADTAFVVPCVKPLLGPLAMTGLMQLLVYHIARELKCPIDKPRHLAKSVTVE
ncbi:TPA: glutamine--fructose-6-phosphate transaminase (isomerizing) [Candidatus Dependentiae bacterium]|nr:glutamine--fructose-6-phosphate transaminase (isomerizing) [Candidatus Dependentiae bacterium]